MPVWKSILNIFTACSEFVLGMSWITVQCVQKLNILQSCRSYTAKQWIHRYYRDSVLIFKLLNDVTFHTQMSIQRIWELNTHPVERRGEKRRWVIRTLRMKGSVSTFSFFRLAFKAAVCQAFCWGKAAAWDHLPNVPRVAHALSFGSISHYLTIKIVKAGFHILCLCFTHCMSYSILNVNYQIRSVVHTTETEDRQQNRRKGRQERQKGFKCFLHMHTFLIITFSFLLYLAPLGDGRQFQLEKD